MPKERHFADDLDQGGDPDKKEGTPDLNQYGNLHDKWNDIQEEYLTAYPDLEAEDLYFEGGGFEGLLERIAEIRGMTVKEVRTEIRDW